MSWKFVDSLLKNDLKSCKIEREPCDDKKMLNTANENAVLVQW